MLDPWSLLVELDGHLVGCLRAAFGREVKLYESLRVWVAYFIDERNSVCLFAEDWSGLELDRFAEYVGIIGQYLIFHFLVLLLCNYVVVWVLVKGRVPKVGAALVLEAHATPLLGQHPLVLY